MCLSLLLIVADGSKRSAKKKGSSFQTVSALFRVIINNDELILCLSRKLVKVTKTKTILFNSFFIYSFDTFDTTIILLIS